MMLASLCLAIVSGMSAISCPSAARARWCRCHQMLASGVFRRDADTFGVVPSFPDGHALDPAVSSERKVKLELLSTF